MNEQIESSAWNDVVFREDLDNLADVSDGDALEDEGSDDDLDRADSGSDSRDDSADLR